MQMKIGTTEVEISEVKENKMAVIEKVHLQQMDIIKIELTVNKCKTVDL